MNVADMMIEIYVAESTVLRTEKALLISKSSADAEKLQQQVNMAKLYVYEANQKIFKAAKDAILSYTDGFEQNGDGHLATTVNTEVQQVFGVEFVVEP